MSAVGRALIGLWLGAMLALDPASAQEPFRPGFLRGEGPRACLNQRERRALIESGAVQRLVSILYSVRTRVPGILIRVRLCRNPDGFAYVLTVLAPDGKVTNVTVDAVKGTFVGTH